MPRYNEITDAYFTEAGDFFLSSTNDLEDTKNYAYRGFIQRLDGQLRSSRNDWRLQPAIGVGLVNMLGEPNTRESGEIVKNMVESQLMQSRMVGPSELTIDVLPVGPTQLAIAVLVTPLSSAGQVNLIYTYDMRENKIVPRNI